MNLFGRKKSDKGKKNGSAAVAKSLGGISQGTPATSSVAAPGSAKSKSGKKGKSDPYSVERIGQNIEALNKYQDLPASSPEQMQANFDKVGDVIVNGGEILTTSSSAGQKLTPVQKGRIGMRDRTYRDTYLKDMYYTAHGVGTEAYSQSLPGSLAALKANQELDEMSKGMTQKKMNKASSEYQLIQAESLKQLQSILGAYGENKEVVDFLKNATTKIYEPLRAGELKYNPSQDANQVDGAVRPSEDVYTAEESTTSAAMRALSDIILRVAQPEMIEAAGADKKAPDAKLLSLMGQAMMKSVSDAVASATYAKKKETQLGITAMYGQVMEKFLNEHGVLDEFGGQTHGKTLPPLPEGVTRGSSQEWLGKTALPPLPEGVTKGTAKDWLDAPGGDPQSKKGKKKFWGLF